MRNTKGITLIALVITIIILIILAGVSINLVMGQDGIITKAQKARDDYQNAASNEQIKLNNLKSEMDSKINGGDNPVITYSYDNPYLPNGFTHTEGTWNSGYVIREVSTGNEFVWVPCVLDQTKVKAGDTVVTFEKALPTTTADTDPLYKYNPYNFALLPADTTVAAEDSSVAEIRTSVGTYGGFYIARYEAGIDGTTPNNSLTTKTLTDGSVKPLSKAGKGVWNKISRVDAITVSKAMINQESTGVKSTLISGECWDTTLQWIVNASDNKTTNTGYDINSEGKGWYNDVSSNTRHLTGYYSVNNIYDMAGNLWEWTTENCTYYSSSSAVIRGGNCTNVASNNPAPDRNNYGEPSSGDGIAFRPVLYK